MRFKKQEPEGCAVLKRAWNEDESESTVKQFNTKSSTLPFGQPIEYSSSRGPTYITAQTLIQQVAYALSDKIFSYSPESFDLDIAVRIGLLPTQRMQMAISHKLLQCRLALVPAPLLWDTCSPKISI